MTTIRLFSLLLTLILSLSVHAMEQKPTDATLMKHKGDVFYQAGRFSEALEYYTQGLDLAESEEDTRLYSACLGNIGNVYASIADYDRGLHYFMRGYEVAVKEKDPERQYQFLTNIVAIYCLKKDVKSAKAFFKQMMALPVKDTESKTYYSLYNQGVIAQAEDDIKMAEFYHRQALEYAKSRQMSPLYILAQYEELGNMALTQNNGQKAIEYFKECNALAPQINNFSQTAKVHEGLSKAYTMLGLADSAAHHKELYEALSDSAFNQSQFYIANNKLFTYENTANKRQIDSLMLRNKSLLLVIGLIVALLAALAVFTWLLRAKNKKLVSAQSLLISKNEELMKTARQNKHLLEQYVDAIGEAKAEQPQAQPEQPQEPAAESTAEAETATAAISEKEERTNAMLSEEQANRLLNKINKVMADVSIISQSDFSLNALSQMVGSNTKYVSWVINETYGKNFRLYLSEYRIREACRRLSDQEHYGNVTLQAIYEELGYNSAASFIQAFKKVNGMTPSTYLKLMRENNPDSPDA